MKPTSGRTQNHLSNLKEHGGLYDYFLNNLKIPKDSPLYEELWEGYTGALDHYTENMFHVLNVYDNNPKVLAERKDLFRWVLAQYPMEDWNTQLQEALFVEESARFSSILSTFSSLRREISVLDIPNYAHQRRILIFLMK